MKIAIDVSQVVYDTGVSAYTRNLVKNLLNVDKNNHYVLFGGVLRRKKDLIDFFTSLEGNFESKILPFSPTLADIFWNRFHKIPLEKFIGNVDVFHSSDWTQPPCQAATITTIHDFVPFKFPRLSYPKIISVHKTRLALVKKEVNKIIVPSFTTKEDVVKLGITEDKITVIPEAADESIKRVNNEEINHIKNKYRISGNYLLAVGVNPRKNTERIIKAFEKVRSGKNDLKLVFIGHSHGSVPNLRNIIFTGHVFTEELSAFYSGAEALIYPSIYEGFGLPVLEAYVCGIPVVTSNISSLTEVAGKAAIMVDPFNVDSMADGINKALRGKYGLVKKGYIEAKKYNWEKTALATLAVYNNAVNER